MAIIKRISWVLLFVCTLVHPALAEDLGGLQSLICGMGETFECGPGAECLRGSEESIDLPKHMKISFKESLIRSMPGAESVRACEIKNAARTDGKIVLQGNREGKAWSMVINEANWKITLSIAHDQAGFIVFGACILDPVDSTK